MDKTREHYCFHGFYILNINSEILRLLTEHLFVYNVNKEGARC